MEMTNVKEEQSDIICSEGKETKFDSKKFKKNLEKQSKSGKPIEDGFKVQGDVNDIPGDPFFLIKYRSFHNHDLDTNYVEHAHMVMDEELHKKGSANYLP